MQAKDIKPGAVLELKPSRREAYGFERETVTVLELKPRTGYKVPWVVARDERADGGLLFFTPSDFRREASDC